MESTYIVFVTKECVGIISTQNEIKNNDDCLDEIKNERKLGSILFRNHPSQPTPNNLIAPDINPPIKCSYECVN